MAQTNEILTVCVGNCGIFAGNEYYSTIMKEHKVNKNGIFTGNLKKENDRLLLNKIDTYFDESKTNKYTPRAMFLDIDKTPINAIKTSPLGALLNDNNMFSSDYCDPTCIYPKAYFDSGADIIDTVMNKIRKQIEVCNYFQGINMIHSVSGGCGSGFASLLLCKMKDEYPKKYNFTHTIYPCIASGWNGGSVHSCRNHNIEIYNCMLAINQLLQYTDMNFVIENSCLLYALYRKCDQKMSDYNDMNWVLSLILSGITSPFRFISESNVCSNLKKMDQCFRLFPRLKFMTVSHAPFFPKIDYKYNDHNTSIINDIYATNIMNNIKLQDGKLFVTGTYYRSNDINAINNMNEFMKTIQQKMADDFVSWIPCNVTSTFIYDGRFECYKNMTTLMGTNLMNTTAIKSIFQCVSAVFAKAYKRKCYLHYYKNEGLDEIDFQIADKNVRDLVTQYQDKQDAIVDNYEDDESEEEDEEDSY
eukprot:15485_1